MKVFVYIFCALLIQGALSHFCSDHEGATRASNDFEDRSNIWISGGTTGASCRSDSDTKSAQSFPDGDYYFGILSDDGTDLSKLPIESRKITCQKGRITKASDGCQKVSVNGCPNQLRVHVGDFNDSPNNYKVVIVPAADVTKNGNKIPSSSTAKSFSFKCPSSSKQVADPKAGWKGVIYSSSKNNADLSVSARFDTALYAVTGVPKLNFGAWPKNPDASGPQLPSSYFGARFQSDFTATQTGDYTWSLLADDGGRFYVNDEVVIDLWSKYEGAAVTRTVSMTAGTTYKLVVEHYQILGASQLKLTFKEPGAANVTDPSTNCSYKKSFPTVKVGKYVFATLDGADPDSTTSGCQSSPLAIPSGYSVAPNDDFSRLVISSYDWATGGLVLEDGSCFKPITYDAAGTKMLTKGKLGDADAYSPATCTDLPRRVLIRSESKTESKNTVVIRRSTYKGFGLEFSVIDGAATDTKYSPCDSPFLQIPDGWSVAEGKVAPSFFAAIYGKFGADHLVTKDGGAINTNTGEVDGGVTQLETLTVNGKNYYRVHPSTTGNCRRVLISRPTDTSKISYKVATISQKLTTDTFEYATIDNTKPVTSGVNCQKQPFQLPEGWSLATRSVTFQNLATSTKSTYGTGCLIYGDGTGVLVTASATGDKSCGSNNLITKSFNGANYYATWCNTPSRVLIQRSKALAPPAVPTDACGTCTSWGDPHVIPFNNKNTYSFYGEGEYIYVRPNATAYGTGPNFLISTNQYKVRSASVNIAITFRYQSSSVTISVAPINKKADPVITVDGAVVSASKLPLTGTINVNLYQGTFYLTSANGILVRATPSFWNINLLDLKVTLPNSLAKKTEGLCGPCATGPLVSPTGAVYDFSKSSSLVPEFGGSWKYNPQNPTDSSPVTVAPTTAAPVSCAADPVTGAIFTTNSNGGQVNGNIYSNKAYVFLGGGPNKCNGQSSAIGPDGDYYFQVTDPSGSTLLSQDPITSRKFTMKNGYVTAVSNHLSANGPCAKDLTIQLMPFADTPNNGGEYKVWATPVSKYVPGGANFGFINSCTKTDNFKVSDSCDENSTSTWTVPPTSSPKVVSPSTCSANPVTGAIFTTVISDSVINGNIYNSKLDVYLGGGPSKCTGQLSGLGPDGDFYYQVTDPSGSVLLSQDAITNRKFTMKAGKVVAVSNHHTGPGTCDSQFTIQLMPFADTPNPGGEYKVWATPVSAYKEGAENFGFIDSCSKTDNFKVRRSSCVIIPPTACDLDATVKKARTDKCREDLGNDATDDLVGFCVTDVCVTGDQGITKLTQKTTVENNAQQVSVNKYSEPDCQTAIVNLANTVKVHGNTYATLDFANPTGGVDGQTTDSLGLPNGWAVADDTPSNRMALHCYTFGTSCRVLSDGKALAAVVQGLCADAPNALAPGRDDCYSTPLNGRIIIVKDDSNKDSVTFNGGSLSSDNSDSEGSGKGLLLTTDADLVTATASKAYTSSEAFSVEITSRSKSTNAKTGTNPVYSATVAVVNTQGVSTVVGSVDFDITANKFNTRAVDVPSTQNLASVTITFSLGGYQGAAVIFSPVVVFKSGGSQWGAGNILSNPTVRQNVQGWLPFGQGFSVDNNVDATGNDASYSLKVTSTNEQTDAGAYQIVTLSAAQSATARSIYFRADVMAKDVKSTAANPIAAGFSLYVDVFYAGSDTPASYGIIAPINPAISSWQSVEQSFKVPVEEPRRAIQKIQFVALLRNRTGTAYFDNLFLGLMECDAASSYETPAVSYADPHLVTLDGWPYDCQRLGDFILYQDAWLSIVTRHSKAGLAAVNSITLLNYQDNIVVIERNRGGKYPFVTVNNIPITLSPGRMFNIPGVGTIVLSGSLVAGSSLFLRYDFDFPLSGHKATITAHLSNTGFQWLQVFPKPPRSMKGTTSGLLGNYNGDVNDDFTDPFGNAIPLNSTISDLYTQFVDSWKISSLPYVIQEATNGYDPSVVLPIKTLADFEQTQRDAAYKACTGVAFFDQCVMDYLLSDDPAAFVAGYNSIENFLGADPVTLSTPKTTPAPTPKSAGNTLVYGFSMVLMFLVALLF